MFLRYHNEFIAFEKITLFTLIGPSSAGRGLRLGAIDAATLGPFEKQADGHERENDKSLLSFDCDFCGRYNFDISLKLLLPDVVF